MKDYKRIEHLRNLNDSLIQERMNRCYDYGYEDGKADTPFTDTEEAEEKAYNRGLNDAWKTARKLVHRINGGYTEEEKKIIFDNLTFDSILLNYTAAEAIAKIKAYEDKQDAEIKVGDEVYLLDENHPRVVTSIFDDGVRMRAVQITENGKWVVDDIKDIHKTGRHFDQIAEVLAEMRGDEK